MIQFTNIHFIDVSTSKFKTIETWDNMSGVRDMENSSFMPIPHKGDLVTISSVTISSNSSSCEDLYKVTEVKYNYKLLPASTTVMTFVIVYVKKV